MAKKKAEDRAAELTALIETGADKLAQQVLDLQDELAEAKASSGDTTELQRQVDDLTERLAATEATKGDSRPVVKVKGVMCLVAVKQANVDGKVMTAKQIAEDAKLLETLYDNGSSVLIRVKQKEKAA